MWSFEGVSYCWFEKVPIGRVVLSLVQHCDDSYYLFWLFKPFLYRCWLGRTETRQLQRNSKFIWIHLSITLTLTACPQWIPTDVIKLKGKECQTEHTKLLNPVNCSFRQGKKTDADASSTSSEERLQKTQNGLKCATVSVTDACYKEKSITVFHLSAGYPRNKKKANTLTRHKRTQKYHPDESTAEANRPLRVRDTMLDPV